MSQLTILFLGDAARSEFRDAREGLARWGAVRDVADAGAAIALIEAGFLPGMIVVAQAFPGQFSRRAIDCLRRLAPLARVLGLMGSWCEGEMRTGLPWPGVVRTYWHQWTARSARALRRLAEGQCSTWALPVTATEEERLMADAADAWPRRHGLIVIDSPSAEMHGWLSAACRSQGFATVWRRRSVPAQTEGAAAALFDGSCQAGFSKVIGDDDASLRLLAVQLRPAPVIALLDFPRIEDYRRAFEAGAARVLSKPLAAADLFWELDRAARRWQSMDDDQVNPPHH